MANHTCTSEMADNVIKAVRTLSEDEKIREYVRQREKAIQDYYSDMAVAESRGKAEEKTNLAIALLKRGKDTIEDISLLTGLSIEEIKILANQCS